MHKKYLYNFAFQQKNYLERKKSIMSISTTLLSLCREAAHAILEVYGQTGNDQVESKSDDTPLTLADRRSHAIIAKGLREQFPDIPVISEEGDIPEYETRSTWERCWLVDPLDGTKEFIKRSGEFTINIALVEKGVPVEGVVYVPVSGQAFFTRDGRAYFLEGGDLSDALPISVRNADPQNLVMAGSRDHVGPGLQKVLENHPRLQLKSMGSSLKFCLLAQGEADLYYRDLPTMEWDTAAAQAVLEAAGGKVFNENGQPLSYNKENLRNPGFMAIGDQTLNWKKLLG